MSNIKITPSMVTLWHVAATITGGIMLPILLGLFQYVSSHGANVGQDVSYGIPVLVGGLATLPVSIWHAVKANPALPQAEKDVEAQAQAVGGHVASQLGTWLEGRFQALENKFAVHQHAAPTPSVAPVNVPQVPFPTANNTGVPTMLNTFPLMPAVTPKQ